MSGRQVVRGEVQDAHGRARARQNLLKFLGVPVVESLKGFLANGFFPVAAEYGQGLNLFLQRYGQAAFRALAPDDLGSCPLSECVNKFRRNGLSLRELDSSGRRA